MRISDDESDDGGDDDDGSKNCEDCMVWFWSVLTKIGNVGWPWHIESVEMAKNNNT